MADNTTLNTGSGGDVIATDDIAGVKFPRSKIVLGADGVNGGDVSSANPMPVTGTGTAGTAATGVVTIQGIASAVAVKVDGSAVTQPVSAASLPLPSGAATAAKQPALGTAGTAAADVITVQGIASMTALKVDGSAVTQPVSGTVTANAGSGPFPVSDNSGSLTVDAPVGTPVFVRLSDGAAAISALPVTDNSGSITVDNAGTFATQATLQAGTALIGQVSASLETATIYSGTTALTPKFAKISAASSGENTIVALVSSKKIRVLSLCLVGVGTAVSIYFKDAASGTAIFADSTNPIPIDKSGAAGAGGLVLGFNPTGWFQSASGGALILNLSAAQAVAGSVTYVEV